MTESQEAEEPEREQPMSREEWMAYLLDQAPEITVEQWDETVAALLALRPLRGAGPQKPAQTKRGASGPDKVRPAGRRDR